MTFKVGDHVKNEKYGEGKIAQILKNTRYPYLVIYKSGLHEQHIKKELQKI